MAKQDKRIYVALMNRIAIALMINQAVLMLLTFVLELVEMSLAPSLKGSELADMMMGMGECAVYFLGFVIPVIVFNFMNKNAIKEIYEPVESRKIPSVQAIFGLFLGLGMITLFAYFNYYAVNLFFDYSRLTEIFWSVELKEPYQIITYFISCAVIPAFVEELLFRATFCKVLSVYGQGTAIVASATIFALMHTNVEQVIYTFVAGLVLGWIYLRTKSLIFPVMLHFINNFISALGDVIAQQYSAAIYEKYIFYSDMLIWVLMGMSIIGLLAYKKDGGELIEKLRLKPDENGGEVMPLTLGERVSGFFSAGMTLFTVYSVATMIYYVYLSTLL